MKYYVFDRADGSLPTEFDTSLDATLYIQNQIIKICNNNISNYFVIYGEALIIKEEIILKHSNE